MVVSKLDIYSISKEASFPVFLWRLIRAWRRKEALVLLKAPLTINCPNCNIETFSIKATSVT